MVNAYTIGRNCEVVLIWNGVRTDLRDVTGFRAQQEVRTQRSDPLNSAPLEFNTPAGWRGQFQLDRGSSAVDDLVVQIESDFWSKGVIGSGTIYQYVTEPDGSTSTYEFVGVSLTLQDSGHYHAENIVKQVVAFYASQRKKL